MQPIIRSEKLSQVHSDIRGPVYVEAMKMIAEGTPVLRLNTGNPATFGFTMPPSVRHALLENADKAVGYCDFRGMPAARQAILEYETGKGIQGLTPDDIFVGNGVSEMAQFAITTLLNYGDEILLPSPSYSLWTNVTLIAGAKPVFYTCDEASDWYPDVEDIRRKITSRTRAILIINPNNPTGALYPRELLEQIVAIAREKGLILLSDEIYDRLVMDGKEHVSTAALCPDLPVLTFNGLSKSHMICGFRCGWLSPWISSVLGIASGVAIGSITEYYTSTDYKPTRRLAEIAAEGDAFVITKGDAIGSRSCLLPVLLIGVSLFISGKVCGTYGIALSSLGMLAFVGATVSIDAFGPIADNAGGLAESCHLDESVRAITDKLDAVGNTTAAIGKGFAIGSAAFATVSLIVAYVGNYTAINAEPVLNMASYIVVAGGIIGGALIEYFSALLTDNTIESARLMADEGDRQLSRPGVLEGTVRPDYNRCIEMAARQALKKMLLPSVLPAAVASVLRCTCWTTT